jgi:hypothetical protein
LTTPFFHIEQNIAEKVARRKGENAVSRKKAAGTGRLFDLLMVS